MARTERRQSDAARHDDHVVPARRVDRPAVPYGPRTPTVAFLQRHSAARHAPTARTVWTSTSGSPDRR